MVENIVDKEEIARYEQFLLFSECFKKTSTTDTEKPGLVWERVKTTQICIGFCTIDGKRNQYISFGLIELISRIF